jgi:hypothetical protein
MLNLVFSSLNFLQLRGTPADLPHRPYRLPILLACDVLLASVLYQLLAQANGTMLAIMGDGLHLLLLASVLWLRSRSARFLQTATAILAVGLVLGVLHLPPILVMSLAGFDFSQGMSDGVSTHAAAGFLQLVMLVLLVWRVLAEGQLLRHALDLPLFAGIMVATTLAIVEIWTLLRLFPTS